MLEEAMTKPYDFGEVQLDVTAGDERLEHDAEADTPFRIAIIGDFSGRAPKGFGAKLAERRAALVDRDNFDQVLAKVCPRIELPLDGQSLVLHFTELDDFHPDRIFERAAIFQRLRHMRDRVADAGTFPQVLAEMGLRPAAPPARPLRPETQPGGTSADVERLIHGDLLEQAVAETQGQPAEREPVRAPDDLHALVQRIVEPQLVARADPRQAETMTALDRAISAQMRALLHVPDFQALESAWRALLFVVRRVETNDRLKLYLLDVSKAEMDADLAAAEDLRSTGTYKLLVEQTVGTPGAEPWALLVANYTFEPTRQDVGLLGGLVRIAHAAGAPFLAAASPRLLGCQSAAELPYPRDWKPPAGSEDARAWSALRKLPEAFYLGLALPRFLLRLPYGKGTDPAEIFDFEEMSQHPAHEDYLWGNPAFACAALLAQAFSKDGWRMRPGTIRQIDDLALHVYQENGESYLKPCAEVLLTEDAAEKILDQGVMPLATLKGRDAVRLVRFQSIADPPRALAGRWG
jgi:type VI secretion system protein ImpC